MSNLETVGPLVVTASLFPTDSQSHSSYHLRLCNNIRLGLVLSCDYWQPDSTCSRPNRFAASGATGHQMRGETHPQTQPYSTHSLITSMNLLLLYRTYTVLCECHARAVSRVNSARCFLKYIHCANQSNKG